MFDESCLRSTTLAGALRWSRSRSINRTHRRVNPFEVAAVHPRLPHQLAAEQVHLARGEKPIHNAGEAGGRRFTVGDTFVSTDQLCAVEVARAVSVGLIEQRHDFLLPLLHLPRAGVTTCTLSKQSPALFMQISTTVLIIY